MNRHTILAFMIDRPGVLNKIAMILRRKMYNIDTLTVCATEKSGISRMTITMQADDPKKVQDAVKQIMKMTEVISAEELDPEKSFWREVALFKCAIMHSKLEQLNSNYKFDILSEVNGEIIVQIAGTAKMIDSFIGEIGMNNVKEIARSGATAMKV